MSDRAEITLHELGGAIWKKVPTAEATEKYDILEVTDDSVDLDDLFGDEPDHFFVHDGSLRCRGPLAISHLPEARNRTVFVVEGDLVVDGALSFENSDIYTPLWVRGSLEATNLAALLDACIFVEGDLRVGGVLATYLTDAGHLVVHGAARFGTHLALSHRGAIAMKSGEAARAVGQGKPVPLEKALRKELLDAEGDVYAAVRDAMLAGRPILV
jgi:hypothetical protein